MRKQILKFMLVICMFCGMLIVPQMDANAASSFFKYVEDGVSITQKSTKTIYVDTEYGTVDYSVDDTDIAEIHTSSATKVTLKGKKAGDTMLRAYSSVYGEFELPITVTSAFYFDYDQYEMERGEYKDFSLRSSFDVYEWESSNPEVAYWDDSSSLVDYKRRIYAKGKGTTIITVTNEYGEKAQLVLTVTADPFVLDKEIYPVELGDDTGFYMDDPYTGENCSLSISDPAIASASWGTGIYDDRVTINGLKAGDTTLTVTNEYGEKATCKVHVYKPLTNLAFSNSITTVYIGSTYKLGYTASPSDANNKVTMSLGYYSSAEYVDFTADGTLIPKKETEKYDYVLIELKGECGKTVDKRLTVKKPYFGNAKYSICRNKTINLKSKLTGESSTNTTWKSSNTSIATVNSKGVVTGKKAGTVTITANSGGCKVTTKVTVKNPTLSKKSTTLYVGKTATLKITGGTGTPKWTSSKKSVATVSSSGKITAKKAGTTTITAKVSGVKLTCKVTVKVPKLNVKSKKIVARDTYKLKLTGGSGKKVWSSSKKSVATVDKNGKITAKKTGTTTISVKVNGYTLKCKVTVIANQKKYSVDTEATRYDYGSPTLRMSKIYYSGNTLKVDVWVMNCRRFSADKFDWLDYDVYDNNGNLIASKTFKNIRLGIKPYGSKKITLTFSGSSLKKSKAILNNGVYDDYEFWYTYTIM